MTFKSYLLPAFQAGMNFDTHKGIPMKIRFAFGIDWVDHKWKESLVLISGDIGIVLLVLTSSVLYLIEYPNKLIKIFVA
jgi:hypothetical protein